MHQLQWTWACVLQELIRLQLDWLHQRKWSSAPVHGQSADSWAPRLVLRVCLRLRLKMES